MYGPGKAHVAEGDPAKIISFKNKSSKQISETCLVCHAGREEHNNFRRGEHWRNDIGCTECHSFVRSPIQRIAYRRGFSHARHDSSESLRCVDYHRVLAGRSQRKQVTVPIPLSRHAPDRGLSCMTCHDGTKAFGGDDFSACAVVTKVQDGGFEIMEVFSL